MSKQTTSIEKPKALTIGLFITLSVLTAAVAPAAAHEFRTAGQRTVLTGKNTNTHEFSVGPAGVVKCTASEFESTSSGTFSGGGDLYTADSITVTPRYAGCTFGGQPATVKVNHCAFVFDSDTTSGNSTGSEHASVEIECAEGNKIEIHNSICTLTIGAQLIKDAVQYENDTISSFNIIATAHNVVVGKVNNTFQPELGCLLMPTGSVGRYTGTATFECRIDVGEPGEGTGKTTPFVTGEGASNQCDVK